MAKLSETKLSQLMQEALPDGGVLLPEQKKHMEIMDETTADVWMTADTVTQQQFDDFPLQDNWRKVGIAAGAMDQALFVGGGEALCHLIGQHRDFVGWQLAAGL